MLKQQLRVVNKYRSRLALRASITDVYCYLFSHRASLLHEAGEFGVRGILGIANVRLQTQ